MSESRPPLSRVSTAGSTQTASSSGYLTSSFTSFLRRLSSDRSYPATAASSPTIMHSQTFPTDRPSILNDSVYTPPQRTASPFQPPPLYPLSLCGYSDSTAETARLLTTAIAEEIRLLVPPRLQLCENWHLVYSLEQDGVSLGTMYKKCDELRGLRNGYVLVVKDGDGGVRIHPAI